MRKKVVKRSLTQLADAAFAQMVAIVIKRAQDTGTPVTVWENNEIKRLQPEGARKAMKKGKK